MFTIIERIPGKFFKGVEGVKGLLENRIEYESNIYRILCCLDKGNLVVLSMNFKRNTKDTKERVKEGSKDNARIF